MFSGLAYLIKYLNWQTIHCKYILINLIRNVIKILKLTIISVYSNINIYIYMYIDYINIFQNSNMYSIFVNCNKKKSIRKWLVIIWLYDTT